MALAEYTFGALRSGAPIAYGDNHIYTENWAMPVSRGTYNPKTGANPNPMKIVGVHAWVWNQWEYDVDCYFVVGGDDVEGSQTSDTFVPTRDANYYDSDWVGGLGAWYYDTQTANPLTIHLWADGSHTVGIALDDQHGGSTTSTGSNSTHPFATSYTDPITWAIQYQQGPSAPRSVTAVADSAVSGQINLTWQAPSDDGGTPITAYVIERLDTDNADQGPTPIVVSATTLSYSDKVPYVGNNYSYRVFARNAVTDHTPSGSTTSWGLYGQGSSYTTAITAVGAPTSGTTASAKVHSTTEKAITVSINSGPTDWGWPYNGVQKFNIYRSDVTAPVATVSGSTYPITWTNTGLTIGQSYTYTVRAANDNGTNNLGPVASAGTVTATGYPTAPYNFDSNSVTQGVTTGRIDLKWHEPTNATAAVVGTNYAVYSGATRLTASTVPALGTITRAADGTVSTSVTNGVVGQNYSFTVAARNAWLDGTGTYAGTGVKADNSTNTTATAVVKMAPGIPTAPTAFTATASATTYGAIDITWTDPGNTPPTNTTAGTLTQYNVYIDGNTTSSTPTVFTSFSAATTPKSATLVGFPTGSHTVTIAARNTWADTIASPKPTLYNRFGTPRSITVTAAPTAPLNLIATPDPVVSGKIKLDWQAPASMNGTFDHYSIHDGSGAALTGQTGSNNVTGLTFTITGALPGQQYVYTVRAWNTVSVQNNTPSPLSNTAVITAQGEAGPPGNVVATADAVIPRRIALTWSAPSGGAINKYNVYRNGVLAASVSGATTSFNDDLLSTSTTYSYTVTAFNTTNVEGIASAPTTPVTPVNRTQVVSDVAVEDTTNAVLRGLGTITDKTSNSISYSRIHSDILPSTDTTKSRIVTDTTNQHISGLIYIDDVPTPNTYRYRQSDLNAFPATAVSGSSSVNVTNDRIDGNQTIDSINQAGLTFTYKVIDAPENVPQRAIVAGTGSVKDNSNTTFNGRVKIKSVVDPYKFTYDATAANVKENDASGVVHNNTNDDLYNGSFKLTKAGTKTLEYDLVPPQLSANLTNLATNPSFETGGATYTLRTNLINNPSFETDLTGWTAGANIIAAQTTDDSMVGGTGSALITKTTLTDNASGLTYLASGLTVGRTYTFNAYLKALSGDAAAYVQFGTTAHADPKVVPGSWTPYTTSFIATSTSHTVSVQSGTATNANSSFYVDHVSLEHTSVLGEYFDGSYPASGGFTYSWAGTVNNSISNQIATLPAGVTNTANVGSVRYARAWRSPVPAGRTSGDYSLAMVNRATPLSQSDSDIATAIAAQYINLNDLATLGNNQTYTIFATITTTEAITNLGYIHFDTGSGTTTLTRANANIFGNAGQYKVAVAVQTPGDYTTNGGYLRLYYEKNSPNTILYVDDMMILLGDKTPATLGYTIPYFSGATRSTDVVQYAWTGTENASTSSRVATAGAFEQDSDILTPYGDVSRSDAAGLGSVQVLYRSGWLG